MFGIIMFIIVLYIYKKTNSIFYCALLHGSYNALTTIFILSINDRVCTCIHIYFYITNYKENRWIKYKNDLTSVLLF